jgi:hypothetical protein
MAAPSAETIQGQKQEVDGEFLASLLKSDVRDHIAGVVLFVAW